MNRTYKCLEQHFFYSSDNQYSIVPIREEDKYDIMQWRNEQIYHLRQSEPLTKERQEWYFENVVAQLFEQEHPNQILFSYLKDDICIGYGGLVHINWIDKHAEISFIIATELERDSFEFHWVQYLGLIEKVAFSSLNFHKIFTFAFDLRPHLYVAVEKAGFTKEASLKEHYWWEGKFIDAIVHSKFNEILQFRKANANDLMLYYEWANDEQVRNQSFNSQIIDLDTHTKWFQKKIATDNCYFYICKNHVQKPVGQVRIELTDFDTAVIGVSIDKKFRGRGLAPLMLRGAINLFFNENNEVTIEAYIKKSNEKSKNAFEMAGFKMLKEVQVNGIESWLYTLRSNRF